METLPSDVVSVVLHKLAVQDPRSLVRATCACKTFHREVEQNRGVWKDAFFGRDSSFGDHCKDENIEAEILALGGYEQLVKVRWDVPGKFLSRQKQGPRSVTGNGGSVRDSSDREFHLNKILVVLREEGRLLLWGLFKKERSSFLREVGDFTLKTARRAEGAPDITAIRLSTSRLDSVFDELESVVYSRIKTKVAERSWVLLPGTTARRFGEYTLSIQLVTIREKGVLLLRPFLDQESPSLLRQLETFASEPRTYRGKAPDRIFFTIFTSRVEPVLFFLRIL
ncbi:hypothetical protein KFL_009920020 [Klebsormidium nitens]|uniref:F-box domain-containing protein n=1 Tax=Klebsormidium nitens TaxID=105231 RepID=A0A1Y1IVR0_KLENI|nr:hypothetical protein KFL_009920020 [Klebsormidium nitens]|eukprot:GAQ92358.1 hypothetical protein KFL_009920020 [Klebsormidium nitens]